MRETHNPNRASVPFNEPFRAVLTAHRSLKPRGFVLLMSALCVINLVVGVGFWMLGAWPVVAFCGLDVALIYLAFKMNYRSGHRYETVDLTPERLVVTQVEPSGRRRAFEFNPYWTRVQLHEHHDGRTVLQLAHHDQRLVFGRFMNDDERRDFAGALRDALARARGMSGF